MLWTDRLPHNHLVPDQCNNIKQLSLLELVFQQIIQVLFLSFSDLKCSAASWLIKENQLIRVECFAISAIPSHL